MFSRPAQGRRLLTAWYCRSCTYGVAVTRYGEVTLVVTRPSRSTRPETVPVARAAVWMLMPAGAFHRCLWLPTCRVTVAGALRNTSASTRSRGAVLPDRSFVSLVCGKVGSAACGWVRWVT